MIDERKTSGERLTTFIICSVDRGRNRPQQAAVVGLEEMVYSCLRLAELVHPLDAAKRSTLDLFQLPGLAGHSTIGYYSVFSLEATSWHN